MNIGLVLASHRRPELLQEVVLHIMTQPRVPDEIVLSVVHADDVPDMLCSLANVHVVIGSAGSCAQRNRGLSHILDKSDVAVFIDDDFIVGDDYFSNLEKIFDGDKSIVGVNGIVIADGANSPGFAFDEGLRLLKEHQPPVPSQIFIRDIEGTYGCNMAFRISCIGSVRFDERLPLYGWQEDIDFCGALRSTGRIVASNLIWGVHLGTKRGKGSEVRLGYSQIINPAYIVRKGNMSFGFAFRIASKNLVANLLKSLRPESYVDRRGRLRGNLIGITHLLRGRLTPEYVLELK
jgi:GT2 family glycosyltransferase